MQSLPVVFAVDRAGNVGSDGETHHGIYDLSYLSHMPNLTVIAPRDEAELEKMLGYAHSLGAPCVIRYTKGRAGGASGHNQDIVIETSKSELISSGEDVEIWALGNMVDIAEKAAEIIRERGLAAGVINARFVKPLDEAGLIESMRRTKAIVTLEDNIITGGFGSCVSDFIKASGGDNVRLLKLGWPQKFLEHGSVDELLCKYKLDAASVAERICEFIEGKA